MEATLMLEGWQAARDRQRYDINQPKAWKNGFWMFVWANATKRARAH